VFLSNTLHKNEKGKILNKKVIFGDEDEFSPPSVMRISENDPSSMMVRPHSMAHSRINSRKGKRTVPAKSRNVPRSGSQQ